MQKARCHANHQINCHCRCASFSCSSFCNLLTGQTFSVTELNEKRRVAERLFVSITTNHRLIAIDPQRGGYRRAGEIQRRVAESASDDL